MKIYDMEKHICFDSRLGANAINLGGEKNVKSLAGSIHAYRIIRRVWLSGMHTEEGGQNGDTKTSQHEVTVLWEFDRKKHVYIFGQFILIGYFTFRRHYRKMAVEWHSIHSYINVNVIYPLGVKYFNTYGLIYIEWKIYQVDFSEKKYSWLKMGTFPGISRICYEGKYKAMTKSSSVRVLQWWSKKYTNNK